MNTYTIPIGGRQTVNPQDVVLLQAEINYTALYLINGQKIMVATPLKTLESRFVQHNFFRTHKSFMVNVEKVKYFFEAANILQLIDNQIVMVSRRKRARLKKCLAVAL